MLLVLLQRCGPGSFFWLARSNWPLKRFPFRCSIWRVCLEKSCPVGGWRARTFWDCTRTSSCLETRNTFIGKLHPTRPFDVFILKHSNHPKTNDQNILGDGVLVLFRSRCFCPVEGFSAALFILSLEYDENNNPGIRRAEQRSWMPSSARIPGWVADSQSFRVFGAGRPGSSETVPVLVLVLDFVESHYPTA